jgi:hypothetical protein
MFPTAEVRWFWQGDAPDTALAWLKKLPGSHPAEETRTDHYLIVSTTDALGIKLREGQIEIKQRIDGPHPESLSKDVDGYIERWTKWSFGLAREHPTLHQLMISGAWVGIKKTRWLKEYRITKTGSVVPLGTNESSTQTCALEIAQVIALDAHAKKRWWTLGLEASGDEAQLTQTLRRTASDVLTSPFPGAMTEKSSRSYPQWLRHLSARQLIP